MDEPHLHGGLATDSGATALEDSDSGQTPLVALIGPPNSGKTTLFNQLTGLRQKVANYPGVTVEKHIGQVRLTDREHVDLVDLPGVHGFSARTLDEKVTCDVLEGRIEGVRPPDALILIAAQRLVKTLCKHCKKDSHPSQEEFDMLVEEYGPTQFLKLGVEYNDDFKLKKPVGCEHCGQSGYLGRMGLYELLEGTKAIKRLIMQAALMEEIQEQAIQDGMATLKQDGIQKILKGECDFKQVSAVCIV